MFHELWLDRLLIALVMTSGTIALALAPIPLWIKLMVPLSTFPLLYFIYEWLTQGETIFTIEKELPERARAIARVLPARLVVFGHTHLPRLVPMSRRTSFVDTGTWAPIWPARQRGRLKRGLRNYLSASFQRKELRFHFGSWME